MKPGVRLRFFILPALAFAALFCLGLEGLPPVGHYRGPYGDQINTRTVPERHITDAVTAVNFDYRGFDTLGEEFIMFASVMGVALLLRKQPGEKNNLPRDQAAGRQIPPASDAVRVFCVALIGPVVVFGIYIVTHGQLTPGGGFQGGVVLAAAPLLVYLAGEYDKLCRIAPPPVVEVAEALGAGGYGLIGLIAFFFGTPFLTNVLPLGKLHDIFSGGTVALIDVTVGLEVGAGFIFLMLTFLREALVHE